MTKEIKIIISNGEGEVIEIIEDIQKYDLDKSFSAGLLMLEIKEAVNRYKLNNKG